MASEEPVGDKMQLGDKAEEDPGAETGLWGGYGGMLAKYFEVYVELDNWSPGRKITREGAVAQEKRLNQTWSMYWLSQRREKRKRGREEKASGEQPATWREVKKQWQLWVEEADENKIPHHGDRAEIPLPSPWCSQSPTLLFDLVFISVGAQVFGSRQAINREVRCELGSCERDGAPGGSWALLTDQPMLRRFQMTSGEQGSPDIIRLLLLVTILKFIQTWCAVLETLVSKGLHGLRHTEQYFALTPWAILIP